MNYAKICLHCKKSFYDTLFRALGWILFYYLNVIMQKSACIVRCCIIDKLL